MSNYRNQTEELAQKFRALGNPHRVAVLFRLMACCTPGSPCSTDDAVQFCVGDLGEGLDIAPSTLSHHLKELQQAGLIQMERQGKQVKCWLEPDVLKQLAGFFTGQVTEEYDDGQ